MTKADDTGKHKPSEKHTLDDVLSALQDLIRNDLLVEPRPAPPAKPAPDPSVPRKRGRPPKEAAPPPPPKPPSEPANDLGSVLASLKELVSHELGPEQTAAAPAADAGDGAPDAEAGAAQDAAAEFEEIAAAPAPKEIVLEAAETTQVPETPETAPEEEIVLAEPATAVTEEIALESLEPSEPAEAAVDAADLAAAMPAPAEPTTTIEAAPVEPHDKTSQAPADADLPQQEFAFDFDRKTAPAPPPGPRRELALVEPMGDLSAPAETSAAGEPAPVAPLAAPEPLLPDEELEFPGAVETAPQDQPLAEPAGETHAGIGPALEGITFDDLEIAEPAPDEAVPPAREETGHLGEVIEWEPPTEIMAAAEGAEAATGAPAENPPAAPALELVAAPAPEAAGPHTDFDDIPVLDDIVAHPLHDEEAAPAPNLPLRAAIDPEQARQLAVRTVARLNIELRKAGERPLSPRLVERLQRALREELETMAANMDNKPSQ